MTCIYNDSCTDEPVARGLCMSHYNKANYDGELGDFPTERFMGSAKERFEHFLVKRGNGCWVLEGLKPSPNGYVKMSSGSRESVLAHRWAYEHFREPIPEGMQVDHLCRVPYCVNPSHMEIVTPQINTLRGENPCAINYSKTHCKRGHEFTPENTYRSPSEPKHYRHCRACKNQRKRELRAKRKAAL